MYLSYDLWKSYLRDDEEKIYGSNCKDDYCKATDFARVTTLLALLLTVVAAGGLWRYQRSQDAEARAKRFERCCGLLAVGGFAGLVGASNYSVAMAAAVQDWDKDALDNDYTKTCAAGCALSLSFGLIATVAGAAAVFLHRKCPMGAAPAKSVPEGDFSAAIAPMKNLFGRPYPGRRNNWFGEVGFKIKALKTVRVVALGRCIYRGDRLKASTTVSLWEVSTGRKLASVKVGPRSNTENGYSYTMLDQAVEISEGILYRISQSCTGGMPDKWQDDRIPPVISELPGEGKIAEFIQGVFNTRRAGTYPGTTDGAMRRPGMVTLFVALATNCDEQEAITEVTLAEEEA